MLAHIHVSAKLVEDGHAYWAIWDLVSLKMLMGGFLWLVSMTESLPAVPFGLQTGGIQQKPPSSFAQA